MARKDDLVGEWLGTLPTEFIDCRDTRHSWSGGRDMWRLGHGFRGRALVCRTCGARKEQLIDKAGRIVVSRMDYPTDYVKPAGLPSGRISVTLLRGQVEERSTIRPEAPPELLVAAYNRIFGRTKT